MAHHTSILDLTRQLIGDDGARAEFGADPHAFLQRHGVDELSPDDLGLAMGHVADALPPALAIQLPGPDAEPWSGGDPLDGLVAQFRGVAEIDPHLTLPELEHDLSAEPHDVDDVPGEAGEAGDDPGLDPLEGLDAGDGAGGVAEHAGGDTGVDPAVHDDEPHVTADHPGERGELDPEPAHAADATTDDTPADGGFGTGDLSEPVTVEAADLTTPAPTFESLDATSTTHAPLEAAEGTDPAFDRAYEADDPFLPREEPEPESEPADLDADSGDWDGDWDHLGGSSLG